MRNCFKIVMLLILILLSSCKNKTQTTISQTITLPMSNVEKSKVPSFPLDTLNFLDYEMLMDGKNDVTQYHRLVGYAERR